MTLHQLGILKTVAKSLNFTKAAHELHISQPSVSEQLRLLQEEYGIKLYQKNGRLIELTQAGRLFLKDAKALLHQVGKLEENFQSNHRKAGSLAIGSSHSPAVSFLPSLMAAFKKTHPEVQFFLQTQGSYEIERLVLNHDVEIALITRPSYSPSLIYEPCRQEKIAAVVSNKHPLAKRNELSLAELSGIPVVIKQGNTTDSLGQQVLKELKKQGGIQKVVTYWESPDAAKATVKAGMGLGIFYRDVVELDIRQGDLKVIKIPGLNLKAATFAVYRKNSALSANARDFLTLLHPQPRKTWQAKIPVPAT